MAEHRYRIGDLVRVQVSAGPDPPSDNRLGSIYEIKDLLPKPIKGEPRYKIRSSADDAEYVVRESQLTPASRVSQPHPGPNRETDPAPGEPASNGTKE